MNIETPSVISPLRALVVEDSTDVLDGLVLVLGTRDVDVVHTAPSADLAIEWLRQNPAACDVAVIDYFLSRGSGLDVIRFLQTQGSPIGRVVLTNYATDGIRRQCEEAGAARVFDKTFEFEAMMDWFHDFQLAAVK